MRVFDKIIAEEIQNGNTTTFEELINKYKTKIFSYCVYFTNNYSDAEDLTQEVLIKIYKNIGTYDSVKSSLSTWIYTISQNTCINSLRRTNNYEELDENKEYIKNSLEEKVEQKELISDIKSIISTLEIRDRTIILLKDFMGLKNKEISDMLNIPEGTVKSRLHSLRMKIRMLVGEKDD